MEPRSVRRHVALSCLPEIEGIVVLEEEGDAPREPPDEVDRIETIESRPQLRVRVNPIESADSDVFQGITDLEIRLADARHRRTLASFVLVGTLGTYAGAILLDALRGTATADPWWTAVGPLAGYVLRVVLEARPGGDADSP